MTPACCALLPPRAASAVGNADAARRGFGPEGAPGCMGAQLASLTWLPCCLMSSDAAHCVCSTPPPCALPPPMLLAVCSAASCAARRGMLAGWALQPQSCAAVLGGAVRCHGLRVSATDRGFQRGRWSVPFGARAGRRGLATRGFNWLACWLQAAPYQAASHALGRELFRRIRGFGPLACWLRAATCVCTQAVRKGWGGVSAWLEGGGRGAPASRVYQSVPRFAL